MKKAACQLLTAVDDGEKAAALLLNPAYAVQQKFDGKRILLQIERTSITAYNRSGLVCSVSPNILEEARRFSIIAPLTFDCEWISATKSLHAFDILDIDGTDIRGWAFTDRINQLHATIRAAQTQSIHAARTEFSEAGKITLLQLIRERDLEGIALKKADSPYKIERQPDQFKYKFTTVSSFLVTKRNAKESVAIGLFDHTGQLVNCGDVKIRSKHFKVREGMIIDVRYAYAFRQSNLVFQPRMESIRDDIQAEDCLLSQLKFKGTEYTIA